MLALSAVFTCAFILSLSLVLPSARLARRLGAIDVPSERKMHTHPTPRMGGVAFFVAFVLSSLPIMYHTPTLFSQLICSGALIIALGISDDIYSLSAYVKLSAQIVIALIAYLLGARMSSLELFGISVQLSGASSAVLTVFFIVLMVNAVNFIDGLDALAACVCLCSLLSLTAISRLLHNPSVFLCCSLAGALLGFLPFNISRASVFMGDTGSTFLGLSLALLALSVSGGRTSASIILILAVPVFDVFFSVFRRFITGKNPFSADRGHIHHVLCDLGLSPSLTVVLITLFSASLCLLGVAIFFTRSL